MLEIIVYIALMMAHIAFCSKILNDYTMNNSIDYIIVFFEILVIIILCILSHEFFKKEPTLESLQKKWKYKNTEASIEYINKYKNHLKYESEDKKNLSILLFFGWIIVNDDDINELILERREGTKIKTMIFKPQIKKSQ